MYDGQSIFIHKNYSFFLSLYWYINTYVKTSDQTSTALVTSPLCAVLPAEVRVPRGAGGLAAGQAEAYIQGE